MLGALTLVFLLAAPWIMKLFAPGLRRPAGASLDLTVDLSQLMFPIVLLLALSGLIVGMLNSFEHFSVPALAPVAWNLVIIGSSSGSAACSRATRSTRTRSACCAGTVVQLLLPLPWLRGRGGRFTLDFDWRNEHVIRVLKLMLPVTIALGLINFSLLINSFFGTLVQEEAPAAIDKAFRIYMLPQGLFCVAIATILFPTLSRLAARGDTGDAARARWRTARARC